MDKAEQTQQQEQTQQPIQQIKTLQPQITSEKSGNSSSSNNLLNIPTSPLSNSGRSRSNSMNSGTVTHVITNNGRNRSSSVSVNNENVNTSNNNIASKFSYSNSASGTSGKNKFSMSLSPDYGNTSNNVVTGGASNEKYSVYLTNTSIASLSSISPNPFINNGNNNINNIPIANFSLADEGYLDTIHHENLKDPGTLVRQKEISLSWTNVNINYSGGNGVNGVGIGNGSVGIGNARKELKFQIRKGIPDKKRGQVWQSIIGTREASDEFKASSFGESDISTRNIPVFGGLISPSDHNLTEIGVDKVKSVLNLIHTNSHIEYSPQISDLVHILLSFMSEQNAYTTAVLMIKDSEENQPYRCLNLYKKECARFVLSFDHLVELHLPKLQRHMLTIGLTNSFSYADEWFSRIFVSFLPYNTVLRIFDVFLSEGYKVLYRIGLALLKTHKKQLKKQNTIDKFLSTLKQLNSQMFDADALIKVAFENIKLKRSHLEDINDKQNHKVKDVPEPIPIYYRPKITTPSQILTPDDFELIWAWLPPRLSISTPTRLFNSVTGGSTIRLVYESAAEKTSILILLKSDNGSVFGMFTDSELKPKVGHGDRNCFLFTLKPQVHIYKPTEKNQLYMNLKEQFIAVGHSTLGEVGLYISSDLNGKTSPTETFNNPCLNDNNQHTFQTVVLEVFTIE